ncbi:MAG TPA: antitoxin Xre/MbcA/ParS toxin-binding domain-containing protein [Aridibacter sp.]|nr:antitoxin Xre/MbcA/ParS toxin-binding domain-containing protein [Aridibacter sp.]
MVLEKTESLKKSSVTSAQGMSAVSDRALIDKYLGITAPNTKTLMSQIERGFPFDAFRHFQRSTGLQASSLKLVIGIRPRTFDRRKNANRFTTAESDRLVSIARLFVKATRLFEGDKEAARRWLTSDSRAFGGLTPLEMAKTETGTREVEKLIGRLEQGVFT